jgi:hypothetical protein
MARHRRLADIVPATEFSTWHWLAEIADVLKDSHAPWLGQSLCEATILCAPMHSVSIE